MSGHRPDRVLFDRGPTQTGCAFEDASAIIRADEPADIRPAFEAMNRAQSEGKWLAGAVSYEFGYLTSPKLEHLLPSDRSVPLMQFGVFDAPSLMPEIIPDDDVQLDAPQPLWSGEHYNAAFAKVHDYITAGDTYQINLTFPMTSHAIGTPDSLYARLCERQPVPHGALVEFGDTVLLSRSPELFFSLSTEGTLTTRPMKGTAPRGDTVIYDAALRAALHASQKNRAENLMIVDLLRNDMSRVSEIGSVKVPDLFTVERFATLHQMTSTITSHLREGTTIEDLFMALFPCGSITGAPKIRAMQIIHEVETQPRDAYCGSIGWVAPDGSMEFNVAIRTLMYRPDNSVQLNVGGGVVYDSTAADEYAEALLKARFASLS